MGPTRKIRGGRAETPTRRKRKIGEGDSDDDYTNANVETSRVEITQSAPNSDMGEPKVKVEVDGIVEVELDSSQTTESPQNSNEKDEPKVKVEVTDDIKVEPDSELEPSVVASNEQEVLSELSNGVPDHGEGVGKLMRQFKEELQPENDGGLDSNTINFQESEMTSGYPKSTKSLHVSTSQRKVNVTTVECENLGATEKGRGNTGDSFNFTYWKLKAEELANLKMKSDKNAHDLETKLLIQKLDSDKKIWDLEEDLAYWKGKAKELERKFFEEVKRAESDRLPDHLSDAAKCLVIAVQSTSTGSSVKSDFFPASSIPSMDESSDKGGRKNCNNSFSVIDAGRKLEVDKSSPASPCLVEMTNDRSAELNSALIIGTGEDGPYSENSFSSLRSATSPEMETVTSCGPKPGKDLQTTLSASDSSVDEVSIAESKNLDLAPAGRLSNNKDNEGKGNAHDSTDVPLLDKNYEKKMSNAECEMEKVEELMIGDSDVNTDSLSLDEVVEKRRAAATKHWPHSQKLKPKKPRVKIQKLTANVEMPVDNELGTIPSAAVIVEDSPNAKDTNVVGSGITEQGIIIQSASASVTEQDSPNSESLLGNADDSDRTDLPRDEGSHDGDNPRKKLRTRSQNKRPEIKGKRKTTAAEIRALSQQISGNKSVVEPGQKFVSPKPSTNPKTGKYKCGDCAAEFSRKQGYHCHYKSLHMKVRFKCVTCGKQFSQQGNYVRHQKSAHLKVRITCDTCGAQFTDRSDCNRHHKSVHAGIRHACQNCKKSFTRPGEVRRHQRATDCGKKLGLGLAPEHTCHLCAKSFYAKNNLKSHMDGVHYKLGEYSCSICGKIYNTKHSLNRHRREVHFKGRKGKPESPE